MGDPEGDRGPDTPPEKSQKFRVFLAIWVQIPENDKATKQAFNVESSSAC